ncbi:hypothetical protein SAMN04488059_11172 [Devosia psychrophila]|nr:hypothetical protein SAMN04488059_11172 [Devosia psychrophila]
MLARQRIVGASIKLLEIVSRESHVADNKPGAVEADGGSFFEGEAYCLGGGAEAFSSLGRRSMPVAAKKKLGASVEV